jgi:hypothetical protein
MPIPIKPLARVLSTSHVDPLLQARSPTSQSHSLITTEAKWANVGESDSVVPDSEVLLPTDNVTRDLRNVIVDVRARESQHRNEFYTNPPTSAVSPSRVPTTTQDAAAAPLPEETLPPASLIRHLQPWVNRQHNFISAGFTFLVLPGIVFNRKYVQIIHYIFGNIQRLTEWHNSQRILSVLDA